MGFHNPIKNLLLANYRVIKSVVKENFLLLLERHRPKKINRLFQPISLAVFLELLYAVSQFAFRVDLAANAAKLTFLNIVVAS